MFNSLHLSFSTGIAADIQVKEQRSKLKNNKPCKEYIDNYKHKANIPDDVSTSNYTKSNEVYMQNVRI